VSIVRFNWRPIIIIVLQKHILGPTGFLARSQFVVLQIVFGGVRQNLVQEKVPEGRVKAVMQAGLQPRQGNPVVKFVSSPAAD
jgi:hypothetical protein